MARPGRNMAEKSVGGTAAPELPGPWPDFHLVAHFAAHFAYLTCDPGTIIQRDIVSGAGVPGDGAVPLRRQRLRAAWVHQSVLCGCHQQYRTARRLGRGRKSRRRAQVAQLIAARKGKVQALSAEMTTRIDSAL